MNAPILVVGAGPTGLTMACELARRGAAVRIVDKLPAIVPYCRATGIHSRTLEVFDDLGIADEIRSAGVELHAISQFVNGRRVAHARFDAVDSPYPFTVSLEQFRTEAILEALLERLGVSVERETELIALEDRLDHVHATLRRPDGGEESVQAPWVIGCDGAHSLVRHLNRQHFPGEADPRQYVLADVVAEPPIAADEVCAFLSDRGVLFVFPLPAGRVLMIADVPVHHDGAAEAPTLDEFQALVAERGPAGLRVAAPRWLAYFRIHYRLTPHYRHDRTFLAGDAAHIHSPFGGHGMNTGIQDAYNLAWKLALVVRGRAPYALLDSYGKERRAVAADVLAGTKAMTEEMAAVADLPAAEQERCLASPILTEAERLRTTRHREELDLDYRRSPICRDGRGRGGSGPHAGAQAPDAGPLEIDGRPATLFEILRGTKHALLLFDAPPRRRAARRRIAELGGDVARVYGEAIDVYLVTGASDAGLPGAPAGPAILRDPERALESRYAATPGCVYLIRPDGYVAYRSATPSPRSLERYLERVFCV